MGYSTCFRVKATEETIQKFRETNETAKDLFEEDGIGNECIKWYEAIDEFQEFSKIVPEEVIELHGEGEERDDNWIAFCRAGVCYHEHAETIWPQYDENIMNYETKKAEKEHEQENRKSD